MQRRSPRGRHAKDISTAMSYGLSVPSCELGSGTWRLQESPGCDLFITLIRYKANSLLGLLGQNWSAVGKVDVPVGVLAGLWDEGTRVVALTPDQRSLGRVWEKVLTVPHPLLKRSTFSARASSVSHASGL